MATDDTATQSAGESAAASAPPQDQGQPNLPLVAQEITKTIRWFDLSLQRSDNHEAAIRHLMGVAQNLIGRVADLENALACKSNSEGVPHAPKLYTPDAEGGPAEPKSP